MATKSHLWVDFVRMVWKDHASALREMWSSVLASGTTCTSFNYWRNKASALPAVVVVFAKLRKGVWVCVCSVCALSPIQITLFCILIAGCAELLFLRQLQPASSSVGKSIWLFVNSLWLFAFKINVLMLLLWSRDGGLAWLQIIKTN